MADRIAKMVLIEKIIIGERQRKEYKDIESLAVSIQVHGLLHPITIDDTFHLIAGGRRLQAHMKLGLKEIACFTRDDLKEDEKKEIELEENVQREDLTWVEKVNAYKEIMEVKQRLYGEARRGREDGWGLQEAADFVGISTSQMGADLQLAKGIEEFPDLKFSKNKAEAFKRLQLLRKEQAQSVLVQKLDALHTSACLVKGDLRVEVPKLPAKTIDLIVVDPPYGKDIKIEVDTEGESTDIMKFDDSNFNTKELLDTLFREAYRTLKDDRVMLVFCDIILYDYLIELGERVGFNVNKTPVIWYKTSGMGHPTHESHYNPSYELILHFQKGYRKIICSCPNVLSHDRIPPKAKIHPTQKPLTLLKQLIENHTLPGELVADFCAGSAATLFAALQTKRETWGCEMNEEYYNSAQLRLHELLSKPVEAESTKVTISVTNFKELTPGSAGWIEWWKAHPEEQSDMIEYQKSLAPVVETPEEAVL